MLKSIFLLILFLVTLSIPVKAQSESRISDPDPLRFENDIETFSNLDKKNSYPEEAVLFVGSSSIRGWNTRLAFPELPVINRGFGGSHISDVIFFYQKVIKKYAPAMIVFYAGDNDIAANKTVKQVFEDYRKLVGRIITDNPDVQFLFIPIKPSTSRWEYWGKMDEFNRQVKAYNQNNSRLFYVDLATPLLNEEGQPDDNFYLNDQLHLNEQGYQVWNTILRTELENMFQNR